MIERSPFPYHGPARREPRSRAGTTLVPRPRASRLEARRVTALLGPRAATARRASCERVTAEIGQRRAPRRRVGRPLRHELDGRPGRGLRRRARQRCPARCVPTLRAIAGSLSIHLGVVGVELAKGKRDRPDPVLVLRSLLQVLVRGGAAPRPRSSCSTSSPASPASTNAAAVLRTELQHHFQELAIIFAGSAALHDADALRRPGAALLRPGRPRRDRAAHRRRRGPRSSTAGSESHGAPDRRHLTSALVAMAEGHPQRAMQLADALWRPRPTGGDRHRRHLGGGAGERAVRGRQRLRPPLRAAPRGPPEDAAGRRGRRQRRSGRPPRPWSCPRARPGPRSMPSSAAATSCADDDGRLRIVDPMLADWIRRRFPV